MYIVVTHMRAEAAGLSRGSRVTGLDIVRGVY